MSKRVVGMAGMLLAVCLSTGCCRMYERWCLRDRDNCQNPCYAPPPNNCANQCAPNYSNSSASYPNAQPCN